MVRWIRSPDWRDAIADLLHRTLRDMAWQNEMIVEIWHAIGMSPAEVVWSQSAATLWPTLTRDAFDAGRLEDLVRAVRARVPAAASALDRVLTAPAASAPWYTPLERHMSMLVGPGCRRALIDRAGLRRAVLRMLQEDYPILAITGGPGSGKSYSRHLIQHIVTNPTLTCDFVAIDIENDWYDDVRAADLVRALASRLGLASIDFSADHVEQSRAVRELVHQLVGRFRTLPARLRWIFIDGLDRPWVRPCVHIAVAQLAKEVESGQLRDTRLVVTGHPGDFCPEVLDVLLVEQLTGLTEHHLREFFHEIADAVGHSLTPEELTGMVNDVLGETDLSDLRALGSAASRAAHARFAPSATA
ncbi:MAG TPA: hypothetical protein VFV67_00410 [Actinophytocola sp.]|uniref:hypothetical protein n=1 Tax=Actinophytocola sp. TaxID=1872138 RepID=UPI002DBEB542|nr:hypothetical protein [Actinophytocola sp.]HEU5469084.1 hypothetical protein [Actinophytocola sp.]